jgi:hypothetical protein
MRQCHFGDIAREICAVARPITEGRPETVRGQIAAAHAMQQHQEGHAERLR